MGKRVYRHKGTGVITDSIFKIGKVLKKPLMNLAKQAGKKVAEKGINKASDVVVKKAGDKIGSILRSRGSKVKPVPSERSERSDRRLPKPAKPSAPKKLKTHNEEIMMLNNLLSQL